MEVDIDVGSSSVAATVVGLVQGATKSLVVDMGIVLEGHTPDELPESLLGTVRASSVNTLSLLLPVYVQWRSLCQRLRCTCMWSCA
jgi:hypothetical protein